MTTFFDTNVVVYAFDGADSYKQTIAKDLLARHLADQSMVISTQVMLEFYVVVTRKRLLEAEDALAVITELGSQNLRPATADSVLRGLALAQRHRMSPWDGLIVQAALDTGCTALLSEDLQAGLRLGDLQVVNPFVPAVHQPMATYARRSKRAASSAK